MTEGARDTADSETKPGYLLVIPWDLGSTGGVSQVVRNLHRELGAAGWAPSVLVSTWDARAPQLGNSGDIRVLRWRIRSPWNPTNTLKGFISYLVTLPGTVWRWRRLARRHAWRIVNFHYPGFAVVTWVLMRRLRLWRGLVVLSVHGKEVRDALGAGGCVRRRLMRLILEGADAVVACAAELAEDVTKIAPAAKHRVSVIPNGVSARLLRAQLERTPFVARELATRRWILNLATFERKKSQDVLIDAFSRLASHHPDVDLVMAGRPTPWLADLRSRAEANGVADRVHFFVDLPHGQIPDLLARAEVFCLPSRAEGHPLAILEAAVFAVPVVATPVGGIPQTITHGTEGLLVPVGDAQALSCALQQVLSTPGFGQLLGRNLQRRVEAEFTWERAAGRYTQIAQRCD